MKSVYYIAEVGKACNGNLDYCKQILSECKKIGVNGVRFHHFFLEESVYPEVLEKQPERAWSFKLQLPFLNEVLFSFEQYQSIVRWCKELGLDFIGSPWDLKSLELFRKLGISHYKINSINFTNIPLVKAVLSVSKKTYLSTGGMSEEEIEEYCHSLQLSRYDAVLLHCVLAYPAPKSIVNIRGIEILQKLHNQVGYSSNDLTKTAILMACFLGASVIEKHVHLPSIDGERHRSSVAVGQFGEEMQNVLEMQEILSRKIKQESRGEMINHELLSKSLVAKEDLPSGTVIDQKNLILQLPPKGVHSKNWFRVIGRKTTEPIRKGSYLFSNQIDGFLKDSTSENRSNIPGKRGVVVRFKDIDEMLNTNNPDYVEVHYAASDLKKKDVCKDYDIDLVVHLPEYADGKLLDLSSRDEKLRKLSIDVINEVMERTRELKSHFKRCQGPVKFVLHPGGMSYPSKDPNPKELYEIFTDSMSSMDGRGLEILLENMTPYPWFIDGDWNPKQGNSNHFLDAAEIAHYCKKYRYTMCLDLCHAKLYCNSTGKDLKTYMETVKPYVKHIHFSDCSGVDGEGLQVGDGDMQWQEICEVFEDFKDGWTPEIWNGHQDHGRKFYESHDLLGLEFEKYFLKKNDSHRLTCLNTK